MARFDAFVSYRGRDESLVKPIVQFMSIGGRRVFWDRVTITPGEQWPDVVVDALHDSDSIVVLWCCHSASSAWVAREVAAAAAASKPLIPVLLCSYPVEQPLSECQWIDYQTSIRHQCVSHASDAAPHPLVRVNVGILVSPVGLTSLEPSAVRNRWIATVSPTRPNSSG